MHWSVVKDFNNYWVGMKSDVIGIKANEVQAVTTTITTTTKTTSTTSTTTEKPEFIHPVYQENLSCCKKE